MRCPRGSPHRPGAPDDQSRLSSGITERNRNDPRPYPPMSNMDVGASEDSASFRRTDPKWRPRKVHMVIRKCSFKKAAMASDRALDWPCTTAGWEPHGRCPILRVSLANLTPRSAPRAPPPAAPASPGPWLVVAEMADEDVSVAELRETPKLLGDFVNRSLDERFCRNAA